MIRDRSIEIVGPGRDAQGLHLLTINSIINGGDPSPDGNLFVVEHADIFSTGDIQVKFSGFAIEEGNATDPGGGISVAGSVNMTLDNMRVFNNQTEDYGGGISIEIISAAGEPPPVGPLGPFIPQMTIVDSQIENNRAVSDTNTNNHGGGVYVGPGGIGLNVWDSSIINNKAEDYGAGLYVGGDADIDVLRTTIGGNVMDEERGAAQGGGMAIVGLGNDVTIWDSSLAGNQAINGGGGLFTTLPGPNVGGNLLTIYGSTFNNNKAMKGSGGALLLINEQFETHIINSTFSANIAGGWGGAIAAHATNSYPFEPLVSKATALDIHNTTITQNRAGRVVNDGKMDIGIGDGGGIAFPTAEHGLVRISSTIVAENHLDNIIDGVGDDIWSMTSFAIAGVANLIGVGDQGNFTLAGQNGTKAGPLVPMLDILSDNGGPTLTHALLPGSPAYDLGNNELDLDFDQRGGGNPGFPNDDFSRQLGSGVDVGAVEGCLWIESIQVNGNDEPQRSIVSSIKITFSDIATFTNGDAAAAFTLEQVHQSYPIGFVDLNASVAIVGGNTVVTLTFTGSFAESATGSLTDGVYVLTTLASHFLPNPSYFSCGMDGMSMLHRLFGDSDGSGGSTAFDFNEFRLTYGLSLGDAGYVWYFDYDGNNSITAADYNAFRLRYGISLF